MMLFSYIAVGGIAALLDIGIFVVFAKLMGHDYLLVAAFGFTLATCVNYVLSIRFTFKSGVRFQRRREIPLIYAISLAGLAINQTILYIGVEHFGLELVFCKFLATGLVFLWNYNARANFVFAPRSTIAPETKQ